jgi:hypothetical protein
VLGTRDILVRIRISDKWIRIRLRIQLGIRLLSSVTLRKQKNIFFIFFSYNLPAGTLSTVFKFNFLLKFCIKILFCKHYFSLLNTFMRKEKDPDPDPYIRLKDPDPDREARKLVDPADPGPDSQHWFLVQVSSGLVQMLMIFL